MWVPHPLRPASSLRAKTLTVDAKGGYDAKTMAAPVIWRGRRLFMRLLKVLLLAPEGNRDSEVCLKELVIVRAGSVDKNRYSCLATGE